MSGTFERHIRLDGAFNVRDLGGYALPGGGATRWRSVLRADGLQHLTAGDVGTLLDLGLATVVDLRSDLELERHPSVLAGHRAIDYRHIPLFDSLAPVDTLLSSQPSYSLAERYVSAAEVCAPALARIAATIAEARSGLVLFNCTAGKDRTGIVAAMMLGLAGVSDDDIAQDYALTASTAGALMDRLREAARQRGLSEAAAAILLSSEAATMRAFLGHVADRHGGFASYLSRAGVADRHLDLLVERLAMRAVETA